jgi:hypothetical protein
MNVDERKNRKRKAEGGNSEITRKFVNIYQTTTSYIPEDGNLHRPAVRTSNLIR